MTPKNLIPDNAATWGDSYQNKPTPTRFFYTLWQFNSQFGLGLTNKTLNRIKFKCYRE